MKQRPAAGILLISAILLILTAGLTGADTFEWQTDGNGNWNDGSNWSRTSGTSTRTFPDDSSDTAIFGDIITEDRTISIPAAGITVGGLQTGDSSHTYALGGTGSLSGGNFGWFSLLNGGTVQFDTTASFGTNSTVNGPGTIIVNDQITNTSFIRFQGGIDLEVNSEFQGGHNFRYEGGGQVLSIGTVSSVTASTNPMQLEKVTVRAVGADRSIDDNVLFTANPGGGNYTFFDGTNGNDLTITGTTQLQGRGGRDFRQHLDTATLELAGNVTWTMTGDRSSDLGDRPDAINLVNNGTLLISGSGNTYNDSTGDGVNIEGNGNFIVNNTTGSATGTGNNLWIDSGVTLGGVGSVSGSNLILRGGTIAPGNSTGTLTVGDATFEAGSTYEWEFGDGGSDLLAVDGNLTIDDDFTIDIVDLHGGPFGTLDLITYTGTLDGDPSLWTINHPPEVSYSQILGDGGSIRLTGLTPEPTTTLLLTLAGLVLLSGRKRP